jgi:hypothetical protein
MAIAICPLAMDTGNLADWAAVVVAAIGAIAVFMLSRAANRTANASLQLTRRFQDRENLLLERESRLLLSEVATDVIEASSAIEAINNLDKQDVESWTAGNGIAQALEGLSLRVADRERDRLHLLPDYAAFGISDAQYRISQLQMMAEEFREHHAATELAAHFVPRLTMAAGRVEDSLNRALQSINFASAMLKSHV